MEKVEAFWICRLFSMQDHQCVQERQWFRWLSKSSYNQEVGSSHPGSHRYRLSLCPRARHFTLNEVDGGGWRGYGTDWHMSQGSCGYYYYHYYFWLIRENFNDYADKDPKSQNALVILLKKKKRTSIFLVWVSQQLSLALLLCIRSSEHSLYLLFF